MGREASPTDRAGETQLVELFGIVIGHTAGEDLPLLGAGGPFFPLDGGKRAKRGQDVARLALRAAGDGNRHRDRWN